MTRTDTQHYAGATSEDERYGLYLYGITLAPELNLTVSSSDSDSTQSVPILSQKSRSPEDTVHQIEQIAFQPVGQIAAIVRRVFRSEFSDETIKERATDRAWLETVVRHHNDIIASIHSQQPILPAKFGSIYKTDADLTRVLNDQHDDLLNEIRRFENIDEWALHLYVNRAAFEERILAEDNSLRELHEKISSSSAGISYMLQKRLDTQLDRAVINEMNAAAQQIHDELVQFAVDAQIEAIREPEKPDAHWKEALHTTYLIDRETFETFLVTVEEFVQQDDSLSQEITGPWPPYSFARSFGEEEE